MTKTKQLEKLELLKNDALLLMEKAGYSLPHAVSVKLDQDLPYMGYTSDTDAGPVIVVSGDALSGNMALNLLIHEMSHVYRQQSNHPSHDQQLLTSITAWVMHGKVVEPYQEKIIQGILNNIQDVYADDISFKIFEKHERLNEFFMNWIHEPIAAKTPKEKWENAESLVSAAFAQGNLERHGIPDLGEKVEKAIAMLLKKLPPAVSERYGFFKEFLVRMPEDITEKEFERMLILFLTEFLKLTK